MTDPGDNILPNISVVTIGLDNRAGLERTARSVLVQTARPDEFIIVDGGSSDGSVQYLTELRRREPWIKVISEPDQGIADAMNKGLKRATGEWICHLHSGDAFTDPSVLADVRRRLGES